MEVARRYILFTYTVYTFFTIQTAEHCLNISKYAYIRGEAQCVHVHET